MSKIELLQMILKRQMFLRLETKRLLITSHEKNRTIMHMMTFRAVKIDTKCKYQQPCGHSASTGYN